MHVSDEGTIFSPFGLSLVESVFLSLYVRNSISMKVSVKEIDLFDYCTYLKAHRNAKIHTPEISRG